MKLGKIFKGVFAPLLAIGTMAGISQLSSCAESTTYSIWCPDDETSHTYGIAEGEMNYKFSTNIPDPSWTLDKNPSWMHIDQDYGQITWDVIDEGFGTATVGTYNFVIFVYSVSDPSISCDYSFQIQLVNNYTIQYYSYKTTDQFGITKCVMEHNFTTDMTHPDWSLDNAPSWMSINSQGFVEWNLTNAMVGSYDFTVRATAGYDSEITCSYDFTLALDNNYTIHYFNDSQAESYSILVGVTEHNFTTDMPSCTWSLTDAKTWMHINDEGYVTWDTTNALTGSYDFVIKATATYDPSVISIYNFKLTLDNNFTISCPDSKTTASYGVTIGIADFSFTTDLPDCEWSLSNAPDWIHISTAGMLTWDAAGGTSGIALVGDYDIDIIATYKNNSSIFCKYDFILKLQNDYYVECLAGENSHNYWYQQGKMDYTFETNMPNSTWSLVNAPTWMHIDQTGLITWDKNSAIVGDYNIIVRASYKDNPNVRTDYGYTLKLDQQNAQEYFKYIDDRTISVAAFNITPLGQILESTSGTAWFYKKLDTYKYEFITNFHVYYGMVSITQDYYGLAFLGIMGNNCSNETIQSDIGQYVQVDYAVSSQDELDQLINPIYYASADDTPKIMDMCAFTLDLKYLFDGTITKNIGGNDKGVDTLLSKIQNIDNIWEKDHQLIKFSDKDPSEKVQPGDRIYIAGYPWATSYDRENRGYTYFTETAEDVGNMRPEQIYGNEGDQYYGYQACGELQKNSHFQLGGGASGSMVINDNYETVGIYWGGFTMSNEPQYFHPCFALFDLAQEINYFNFFTDWVDKYI